MAKESKFLSLTEAKFTPEMKKIRDEIRKHHEAIAKVTKPHLDALKGPKGLEAQFATLGRPWCAGQAKELVALVAADTSPHAVKTAAAEALAKLGANEDGELPLIDKLVFFYKWGTAVTVDDGTTRKRGGKVAVI